MLYRLESLQSTVTTNLQTSKNGQCALTYKTQWWTRMQQPVIKRHTDICNTFIFSSKSQVPSIKSPKSSEEMKVVMIKCFLTCKPNYILSLSTFQVNDLTTHLPLLNLRISGQLSSAEKAKGRLMSSLII